MTIKFRQHSERDGWFWSTIGPHACGMVRDGLADRVLVTEGDRWFFASDGEDVIGLGCLRVSGTRGHLCHGWVAKIHRGNGIARGLAQARIACGISTGLATLTTIAAPTLVGMFTKLDFKADGTRGSYTKMKRCL